MSQGKVMIVDDDPDVNCTLQTVLEHSGFKVECFYDGESALKKIKDIKPDLVILDVMMPGMSGYEVCEKIKSDPETSHIKVIMLTARDMGDDVDMALRKKADWFVTKPYDNKYLVSKIDQFIAKKG